jgi:peptidoglycan/LPS O-acetylase OafA/YrhL
MRVLKKPGFDGGFVGVDVFFVISGFLITSLIVNDLKQGRQYRRVQRKSGPTERQ